MHRLALAACALAVLAVAPAASSSVVPGAPTGLRAFLLRVDEPIAHQFPRTPSFAWNPVAERGGHYQFELSSSPQFDDGSLVFKDVRVTMPAETIPRELPWMVGEPYALWAHVRWISADGSRATPWSTPFGFNMRWDDKDIPVQETAPVGLIRWDPVDGATGYQVIYLDVKPVKAFQTTTNVADEREYFTFHSALGYSMQIHWRVRAIRDVGRLGLPSNGLPAVSYGPWSPTFTSTNAAQTPGTLAPTDTVSDAWSKVGKAGAFSLTPAFAWNPSNAVISDGIDPGSPLYRVYIFTDNHCVNRVFTGSIVGSPAWAPRTEGGPIKLPSGTKGLGIAESGVYPGAGIEGTALDAVGEDTVANEGITKSPGGSGASGAAPAGGAATVQLAMVDLWDSGWPTGRYYWTVVPVTVFAKPTDPSQAAQPGGDVSVGYQDAAVPQDACEAGDMMSFGKITRPVVTSSGRPFVSGIGPGSRVMASAGVHASVYSSPLVAWQPAVGATRYQVELSRSLYPWHSVRPQGTPATSMVLPLSKFDAGTWYYRVRGINDALPVGAQRMAWSTPVRVEITGDRFSVVK